MTRKRKCHSKSNSFVAAAEQVCLSVCLSVTSRCSIVAVGRIDVVLGTEASFDQSYTVFLGNSGIYRNKGTSLWNFFLNSGLRKISPRHIIVEACCRLSS